MVVVTAVPADVDEDFGLRDERKMEEGGLACAGSAVVAPAAPAAPAVAASSGVVVAVVVILERVEERGAWLRWA
jgi:hypothetical protein